MPGFPVLHYLPKFAQTHVHCVNDAIQPSHSLFPPSPPALNHSASQSFPMNQFFTSGGQNIEVSASVSVLPMTIQGSHPSGLTDLVSLLAKGLSRALRHQFESINSSALSLIYGPTLTTVHDYWKSYGFDYMALCQQNDVSTF